MLKVWQNLFGPDVRNQGIHVAARTARNDLLGLTATVIRGNMLFEFATAQAGDSRKD
ncbi:hypothetical protein LAB1_22000 [Roseibium sp. LAB1]